MNEYLDYFEDIDIGKRYVATQPFRVSRDDIVAYALMWDWRPHHVDEQAASESLFQGLVACGSHVFAIWTRLSLQAQSESRAQAVMAGLGCEMRVMLPVRSGDEIFYSGKVVAKRESKSCGDAGIFETHHELHKKNGDLVFQVDAVTLVRTRPSR